MEKHLRKTPPIEEPKPLLKKVMKKPKKQKQVVEEVKVEPVDEDNLLKRIANDESEIKNMLWKHFAWDMAKEFMYGMAIGIIIGLILSKILLPG